MATKGKAKKGTKKQAKGQAGAWPTLMGAVNGMDKQVPSYQPGPAKASKGPRITPKFRKLK